MNEEGRCLFGCTIPGKARQVRISPKPADEGYRRPPPSAGTRNPQPAAPPQKPVPAHVRMNQAGDRLRADGNDLMKTGAAITGGCLGLVLVGIVLVIFVALIAVLLGF